MSPIKELYVWVVDDPSAAHGIVVFLMQDGHTGQAVTSKRHIADLLKPQAVVAARLTGLPVQLQRFTLAETMDEAKP